MVLRLALTSVVFLPETKGLSLEGIDQLFHERVSTLRSLRWKPTPAARESDIEGDDQKVDGEHLELAERVERVDKV